MINRNILIAFILMSFSLSVTSYGSWRRIQTYKKKEALAKLSPKPASVIIGGCKFVLTRTWSPYGYWFEAYNSNGECKTK